MEKSYGSAMVDYIIPTALIGLVVGVSLYYFVSDQKLLNFLGASANMDIALADQMGVIGNKEIDPNSALNKLTEGDLGGTPDNPVKQCNAGICDIDYGELLLTGIPQNFEEFVSTTGSSGGTDKISSIIQQIADQLEDDGLMNESLEIRKLASMGHNMAALEKEYETAINACNGISSCVVGLEDLIMTKPANYDDTFYPFEPDGYGSLFWDRFEVGVERNKQLNKPAQFNTDLSEGNSAALFVDKYQSIMDSTAVSDTTKGIVKELYWEIAKLSENFHAGYDAIEWGEYCSDYYDPITGEMATPDLPANPFDIYSGYKPSSLTHIDSALICAAGYFKDTGTKCH